jgi:hypothetical protein
MCTAARPWRQPLDDRLGGAVLLYAVNHHFSSRGCGAGRSVNLNIALPYDAEELSALAIPKRAVCDFFPEVPDDQQSQPSARRLRQHVQFGGLA